MSNKVVIGIVAVVIVAGVGFFLVYNKSPYSPPVQPRSTAPGGPVTQPASPGGETAPGSKVVTLTQAGFSPATLTVTAGTKVTWTNKSGGQATVNSGPHPIHTGYSPLNLGSFSDGRTLSLTFDKPGTYGYHNHLSPGQTGTIIVQ